MDVYPNLTEDNLRSIVNESHSWMEVIEKCGLKTITRSLQKNLKKYNIDCSHFERFFDGRYTRFNKFTKKQLMDITNKHDNWKGIMEDLGYITCDHVHQVQQKLEKVGISFAHVNPLYYRAKRSNPLDKILVQESHYTNMTQLRSRLQKELGWEHKCTICNNTEWNGQPIPIQIDHINGEHTDNRIENLRFLCPNCHAQTDTYCGKNTKICKEKRKKKMQASTKNTNEEPHVTKQKRRKTPKEPAPPKHVCIDCNKKVAKGVNRCKKCYDTNGRMARRKVERPSYEQVQKDLDEMSMVKVGKKYGVSDKCIRKWLKYYEKQ